LKPSKAIHKKIIAGKFKGKTVSIPSKQTTRSSKTIVLESFFNTIQFEIIDAWFVELFSGSGSVGLEALSRGASGVIFMEQDRAALKVLKKNITQTDPAACEVLAGDTFINISQVITRLKNQDIPAYFYIDPPFSIREGHQEIYEKMVKLIENLPVSLVKLIAIEHMSSLELPKHIGPFVLQKRKKFGKSSLSYFKQDETEL